MKSASVLSGVVLLTLMLLTTSVPELKAQVGCPPDLTLNQNDPPVILAGGIPEGGSYEGPGVTGGNLFDPGLAGPGTHPVTYTVFFPPGEWISCTFLILVLPGPQPGIQTGGFLQVGQRVNPEPWLNWIDASQGPVPVTAKWVTKPGFGVFLTMEFQVSEDSLNWETFAFDADGSDLLIPGPVLADPALSFTGWSAEYLPAAGPGTSPYTLYFRAVVQFSDGTGDTLRSPRGVRMDPTPPGSVQLSIPDFYQTTDQMTEVVLDPGLANLVASYEILEDKFSYYQSDITGYSVQPGASLAGAAAAVLAGLSSEGYPEIMGGLTQSQLTDTLVQRMGLTDTGTEADHAWGVIQDWASDHGDLISFAGDRLEVYFDPAYTIGWTVDDWYQIRNGFESGQGLLLNSSWMEGGQVHSRAFACFAALNIVILSAQQLSLLDPVTGTVVTADLDALAGRLSGFRDSMGNLMPGFPAEALISSWLLVRLKQQDPSGGMPLLANGPGPHQFSIDLPEPGLYWLRLTVLDADGHAHTLSRVVQRLPQPYAMTAGDYAGHPFDYGRYLPFTDSLLRLCVRGSMPGDTADWTDFFVSTDSFNWIHLGSDDDGRSRAAPGPASPGENDGWTAWIPCSSLPLPAERLYFKAEVTHTSGVVTVVPMEYPLSSREDPPTLSTVSFTGLEPDAATGFYRTPGGTFSFDVDPGPSQLLEVGYTVTAKTDSFAKGVPGVTQPGAMDCAPAALAACLWWFHTNGDGAVAGGLGLAALIDSLRKSCNTDSLLGTYDDDLVIGAGRWLKDHGYGYSVRHLPYERIKEDGSVDRTWTAADFETMRAELENGQDVITLFNWTDADGNESGHYMTMNSLVNKKQDNGTYRVDYMDPLSGSIIFGDLDPNTGRISGFSQPGGGNYPPDSASITSNLIICPADTNPVATGTALIPGPDPGSVQISLPGQGMYWLNLTMVHPEGYVHKRYYPILFQAPDPCPPSVTFAASSDPVPLWILSPVAGEFSGPGVAGNLFHPDLAGPGSHALVFTYTNSSGETASCDFVITLDTGVGRDFLLAAGPFLDPEPMHDYLAAGDSAIPVYLYGDSLGSDIQAVAFSAVSFFNPGSDPFIPYYPPSWPTSVDSGGTSRGAKGPLDLSRGSDGWMSLMPDSVLPETAQPAVLNLLAAVIREEDTIHVCHSVKIDPSPPHSVNVSIPDWHTTTASSFYLHVEPVLANLSEVICEVVAKPDSFAKGIPPIGQPGDNDCGPTSMAACFKWFAAQGDTGIIGDRSDQEIIDSLRKHSKVPAGDPVGDDDLASAARKWLSKHGKGYEVRRISYLKYSKAKKEYRDFGESDWKKMRDELEKGQNVITLFNWVEGEDTLGHFMTFNSIVNRVQENGKMRVDFMDPASGEIVYTDLDPETGKISGCESSDGVTYPPDGAEIVSNLVICPKTIPGGGGATSRYAQGFLQAPDSIYVSLPEPGLYWIRLKLWDMDGHYAEIDRVVERIPEGQIQGIIAYDNLPGTLLDSVTVSLVSGTDTVAVSLTDSLGQFTFAGLMPGSYQVVCNSSGPWGGVNAIDALEILKHFVEADTLTGLRLTAADIDVTGFINATDGLQVARRFTEIIGQFAGSDWIFEEAAVELAPGQPAASIDLKGICRGDVNGSYVPQ